MTLIALLEYLPVVRRTFLSVLLLAGGADLVASIVLLAYQLALTEGYQPALPPIIATSFLSAFLPIWFLFSRPYSIRLPLSSGTLGDEPRVGSVRDKAAKFSRSIAAEVVCLGGVGVWLIVAVGNLHAETPGLISHCGGWAVCRMLLAVFSLTWICFLFLALSFTSLLVSTLYFTIRRRSPFPLLLTSFNAVDWERYAGRPVGRANTVKVSRSGKTGGAGGKSARERERGSRGTSEAPVLPVVHGLGESTMTASSSFTSDFPPRVESRMDWDVQSTFTAPSIPYGGGESRPSSVVSTGGVAIGTEGGLARMIEQERERDGRMREGEVFVLIEEAEAEEGKGVAK
ncbi:hypothetical protein JCM8547_000897 [Rhodosporidiobolus lusitaniae]